MPITMPNTRKYEDGGLPFWIATVSSVADYFGTSCSTTVDKIQCGGDDQSFEDMTVSTASTTSTLETKDDHTSQFQARVVIVGRLHAKEPSIATILEHSNTPLQTKPDKEGDSATSRVASIGHDLEGVEASAPLPLRTQKEQRSKACPASLSPSNDAGQPHHLQRTSLVPVSAFLEDKEILVQGIARCRQIQRKARPGPAPIRKVMSSPKNPARLQKSPSTASTCDKTNRTAATESSEVSGSKKAVTKRRTFRRSLRKFVAFGR